MSVTVCLSLRWIATAGNPRSRTPPPSIAEGLGGAVSRPSPSADIFVLLEALFIVTLPPRFRFQGRQWKRLLCIGRLAYSIINQFIMVVLFPVPPLPALKLVTAMKDQTFPMQDVDPLFRFVMLTIGFMSGLMMIVPLLLMTVLGMALTVGWTMAKVAMAVSRVALFHMEAEVSAKSAALILWRTSRGGGCEESNLAVEEDGLVRR